MYIASIKNWIQWDGDRIEGRDGGEENRNEPENDENLEPLHGFHKNEILHKGQ